jgi:predicted Zn-ribbon and HTH transcriptional regulator
MNREQYLTECVNALSISVFTNYTLPPVNVSCSWPGGRGSKNKTIGQCWARSASKALINEIFISPVVDKSIDAIDILTHELIHAIDDCEHGHRKQFTSIMRAIGLEGKPTATHAGERLHAELSKITDKLGDYPHSKLTPSKPKQKSRQLKASCNDCGAVWRMSKQWLDQAKSCPVCQSTDISID